MLLRIIIEIIVSSLIGLAVFSTLVRRPERFWSILIGTAIITGGLIQGPGYALLDEFLMLFIIVAIILAALKKRISWDSANIRTAVFIITTILLGYLLIHSLFSVYIFNDIRLLRWTLLYSSLLILFIIAQLSTLPKPDILSVAKIICVSGSIYLGLYALHWIIMEKVLGLHWGDFQAISWSGSTYALYVCSAIIPSSVIVIKHQPRSQKYLGFIAFFCICLAANLYDSRMVIISLLLACILSLFYLKKKHAILLITMYLLISIGPMNIFSTFNMILESILMPVSPRISDRDRYDHAHAAMTALKSGSLTQMVFGYGEDRHKKTLSTTAELLKYGENHHEKDIVRSCAFTAFVINQGIIGLVLICFLCIINLYFLVSEQHYIVVPFYCLSLIWSMTTDYRDIIFVYLMLFFGIFSIKRQLVIPGEVALGSKQI